MKRPMPVAWLLARKTRECRDLRDELTAERVRVLALEARLGVATRERDQARRDVELVALMARDRNAALAFLRTAHGIERLEEAG